jgi:N-acyl-D-aspartate/D-glutamate deacylase
LCLFDTDLKWSTISANRSLETVRETLMDPLLLPGFNDSGAHLSNMAFYDGNLRSLKLASLGGESDVSFMVKRLTQDPAEIFGVSGGTLDVGDKADLILVNPENLKAYVGEDSARRVYREEYQHEQLVNRSDGVVPLVMISGEIAWQDDAFSESLGKIKMGQVLRSKNSQKMKSEKEQATPDLALKAS